MWAAAQHPILSPTPRAFQFPITVDDPYGPPLSSSLFEPDLKPRVSLLPHLAHCLPLPPSTQTRPPSHLQLPTFISHLSTCEKATGLCDTSRAHFRLVREEMLRGTQRRRGMRPNRTGHRHEQKPGPGLSRSSLIAIPPSSFDTLSMVRRSSPGCIRLALTPPPPSDLSGDPHLYRPHAFLFTLSDITLPTDPSAKTFGVSGAKVSINAFLFRISASSFCISAFSFLH